MKFQVEVYHHFHGEVEIRSLLATLITQGRRIMSSLEELHVKADALLAKVEAEKTIENSLITLLAAMVTNNRKLAEDLAPFLHRRLHRQLLQPHCFRRQHKPSHNLEIHFLFFL